MTIIVRWDPSVDLGWNARLLARGAAGNGRIRDRHDSGTERER